MNIVRLVEYGTLVSMIVGSWMWMTDIVATKKDVLIAVNNIEAGRIASDKHYFERIGLDNLSPEDKERFRTLKLEEKVNEAQHARLLGLD